MEADHNPMPEELGRIDLAVAKDVLIGAVSSAAHRVHELIRMPREFASHGRHTFENTGAAPMIDTQLYDTPEIPGNIDLGLE